MFTKIIEEKGLEQSHADQCLFRRFVDGKVRRLIVGYIDDILLASKLKDGDQPCLNSVHAS